MADVAGLPVGAVFRALLVGGLLGLPAVLVVDPLLGGSALGILVIGLIGEALKLIGFVVLLPYGEHTLRTGFALGASVGLGFGLVAALANGVPTVARGQLLATLLVALGPLAQAFFTAILGGLLAARERLDAVAFWSYVGISVLHALWFGMDRLVPAAVTLVAAPNVFVATLFYLFGYALIVLAGVIGIGAIMRDGAEPESTQAG